MKDVDIQKILDLDSPVDSPLDLVELGSKGVLKRQIKRLADAMCITNTALAGLLAITPRTIQRYPESKPFDRTVSERAIKLAMLTSKGIRLFGDSKEFCAWLQSPCVALGNRTPLNLLASAIGLGLVEDVLGRIEYGVFS
jgi:putative toxin-antitoxin system antitoxin component (TIGR02293 family)